MGECDPLVEDEGDQLETSGRVHRRVRRVRRVRRSRRSEAASGAMERSTAWFHGANSKHGALNCTPSAQKPGGAIQDFPLDCRTFLAAIHDATL